MVEQSSSHGSRNGIAEAMPFSETILMLFYECRLNGRAVYSILGSPFGGAVSSADGRGA